MKFYLSNGASRHKLVLGIPTYGRSYTLANPDAHAISSPATAPGEKVKILLFEHGAKKSYLTAGFGDQGGRLPGLLRDL